MRTTYYFLFFIALSVYSSLSIAIETSHDSQQGVTLCSVCLEDVLTDMHNVELGCHTAQAHRACIHEWLERHYSCPLCSKSIHGILVLLNSSPSSLRDHEKAQSITNRLLFGELENS